MSSDEYHEYEADSGDMCPSCYECPVEGSPGEVASCDNCGALILF